MQLSHQTSCKCAWSSSDSSVSAYSLDLIQSTRGSLFVTLPVWISKPKDDYTAEVCLMVCPALTPVFPTHICLIFSSSEIRKMRVREREREREGVREGMRLLGNAWGPLGAVQPCDECVFQKLNSPEVSKSPTLYALTGQLVSVRGAPAAWPFYGEECE